MVTEFASMIVYTQLIVATPAQHAAIHWTDDAVAQGFAWDGTSVAFGVPDHDGDCLVRIMTGQDATPDVAADALWAVAVPFTASGPMVEVGALLSERPIPIAPDQYQLVFQARPGGADHAYRLDVSFTPQRAPDFAILKQGSLQTARVLETQAPHP